MDGRTDGSITVGVKGLVVTGLVLLGLAVAYLLGDAGGGAAADAAPAPATATPAAAPGTVTMGGAGEATAVPDQVEFSLAVGATRPSLDEALDVASTTMDRVLGRLSGFGVRKGDVQTTGLSMNPVYDYVENGPPVLRGYRVSQRAQVLVTELARGGAAISAAVGAGGNGVRVSDIRLGISDPDAALAQARQAAVAEATAKAEEYAEATGQELGGVVTLREVSATPPRESPVFAAQNLAAYDAAAVPIRAGKEDLAVRVEVVWRLA
ncbi:SIMPL domain-containing protein [Nocardioides dongkuii]|uniref:SIMPL domain-containing protein n=1 Tax=Nocardioides dongkuii TaxID=2760089 RepID=UPI0015FAD2C4|nr:SIMPL domain-containing protein [Nocardioides dongkuii]